MDHFCGSRPRAVERKVINRGYRSKRRTYGNGQVTGANPLNRGQINFILRNPVYVGRIRHKEESYDGLHDAIVNQEVWDDVQTMLDRKSPAKSRRRSRSGALLTGRIFDETGDCLTPTHAQKGQRRYRYYVSGRVLAGDRSNASGWRLSARQLEDAVSECVAAHLEEAASRLLLSPSPSQISNLTEHISGPSRTSATELVERIQVNEDHLDITLSKAAIADLAGASEAGISNAHLQFEAPFRIRRRGNEMRLVYGASPPAPDPKLIRMMALAHSWLEEIKAGTRTKDIAARYGWQSLMVRQRLQLAFLSPKITQAILAGVQPESLTLTRLVTSDIPLDWDEQWAAFGFDQVA